MFFWVLDGKLAFWSNNLPQHLGWGLEEMGPRRLAGRTKSLSSRTSRHSFLGLEALQGLPSHSDCVPNPPSACDIFPIWLLRAWRLSQPAPVPPVCLKTWSFPVLAPLLHQLPSGRRGRKGEARICTLILWPVSPVAPASMGQAQPLLGGPGLGSGIAYLPLVLPAWNF